jgi:MoaA/NifB/PqqE/SkfB family radical SAM enzyme
MSHPDAVAPREYDFANVLFAGPCNRYCPFCIGKQMPAQVNASNLDVFPPKNWDALVAAVVSHGIPELVFTGTTTDPHLYKYEEELIGLARQQMPDIRISIHTNGTLSLKKIQAFNKYDRACISLPTLEPQVYSQMMGSSRVPDIKALLAQSLIPLKISCIVNEYNKERIEAYLHELSTLGIQRVVLRQLFGEEQPWDLFKDRSPQRYYRENPVYLIGNLEVTLWTFCSSGSRSLNLFADGTLGTSYLLTETPELTQTANF